MSSGDTVIDPILTEIEAANLSLVEYRAARRLLDRLPSGYDVIRLTIGEAMTICGVSSIQGARRILAGLSKAGILAHTSSDSAYVTFASRQASDQEPIVPDVKPRRQHVYFIRGAKGGPVKIGIAADITERIKQLQRNHADTLGVLGVIPQGGRETERELHARFAQYRLHGEWFEWNAEIEAAIPC